MAHANVRRLAGMATAGAMTLISAPLYAQSGWQDERDWRPQYRTQYDDRYGYSGQERDPYAQQWRDERGRIWRDARRSDQWRMQQPYAARERERMRWNEYDRYGQGDNRYSARDRNLSRYDGRDRGLPSYPSDFYAGRGPGQFQGRQDMSQGFDYYDFYGTERPSNRPGYSDNRARMDERASDRARMRAERDRRNRNMAEERQWREDYRRWARGQSDLYDGRYQLPDYDGDFAGSSGVGMGDMTGRGVGMPDYYQGERGGAFHGDPGRWADVMQEQGTAERDSRDQMGQNAKQATPRRGGPPMARAVAGSDTDEPSAESQPNIPGQSQGSVGHPRSAQTTGQGQGVIETNTSEVTQPQTQIPEQSLGTVGHPGERDVTGQGDGVAEQPAGNDNSSTSR